MTPIRAALLASALAMLVPAALPTAGPTNRWVFLHSRLLAQGGLDEAKGVVRRAAAAGYNGIVLSEATLSGPRPLRDADTERLRDLVATAAGLGLEVIPAAFHTQTLMSTDPNLVEAAPVRDVPFIVKGSSAVLVRNPLVSLASGGSDDGAQGRLDGWRVVRPGSGRIALDRSVRHTGSHSLRIEPTSGDIGDVVLAQAVKVAPFRQYLLSAWVRTKDFTATSALQIWPLSEKRTALAYPQWRAKPTSDWQQMHCLFNSLQNESVTIELCLHKATRGSIWLDSASLEETALVNVVRRPGCPLTVRGRSGRVYDEDRDYASVRDPRSGNASSRGQFDDYHEPPAAIRVLPGGRIRDSERLRISYYAAPVVFRDRVTQCLSEPAVYSAMRSEMQRVHQIVQAKTYLLSHSEMRVMNWCQACRRRGMTPGALLADHFRRSVQIVREVAPGARVAVWSDMLDPHHNAREPYYFVNGSLNGSFAGLPHDALVLNWNRPKARASLDWFAKQGFTQIIAGYYDQPIRQMSEWNDAASGLKGIDGWMYTTWQRRYEDLEGFARAAADR